jgi:hypothetical protein
VVPHGVDCHRGRHRVDDALLLDRGAAPVRNLPSRPENFHSGVKTAEAPLLDQVSALKKVSESNENFHFRRTSSS